MSLERGKFEVNLPGHVIPKGETKLRKTGYVIIIIVNFNTEHVDDETQANMSSYQAKIKLPQFVNPYTVTVDFDPTQRNFHIEADIKNSAYKSQFKKSSKKSRVLDMIFDLDMGTATKKRSVVKRRNSLFGLKTLSSWDIVLDQGKDATEASSVKASEPEQGRYIVRRRNSSAILPMSLPTAASTVSLGDPSGPDTVRSGKVKRRNSMFASRTRPKSSHECMHIPTSGTASEETTDSLNTPQGETSEDIAASNLQDGPKLKRSKSTSALKYRLSGKRSFIRQNYKSADSDMTVHAEMHMIHEAEVNKGGNSTGNISSGEVVPNKGSIAVNDNPDDEYTKKGASLLQSDSLDLSLSTSSPENTSTVCLTDMPEESASTIHPKVKRRNSMFAKRTRTISSSDIAPQRTSDGLTNEASRSTMMIPQVTPGETGSRERPKLKRSKSTSSLIHRLSGKKLSLQPKSNSVDSDRTSGSQEHDADYSSDSNMTDI